MFQLIKHILILVKNNPYVFQIIVLMYNLSTFELQGTNWWLDILLQDFEVESKIHDSIYYVSCPGPEAAKQPQNITIPPPCMYNVLFMKCCVSFTADVTGFQPMKKKMLHQSTEYFPKSLEDKFSQNCISFSLNSFKFIPTYFLGE